MELSDSFLPNKPSDLLMKKKEAEVFSKGVGSLWALQAIF